jgi:hypothetical protein
MFDYVSLFHWKQIVCLFVRLLCRHVIWQEQQQTVLSGRDPWPAQDWEIWSVAWHRSDWWSLHTSTVRKIRARGFQHFYNYFNQEYDITLYYIYRHIYIKTIYIYLTNYLQPNLWDSWWNRPSRPRFSWHSWHPQGNHRAFEGGWKWHLEVMSGGIGDGLYWL